MSFLSNTKQMQHFFLYSDLKAASKENYWTDFYNGAAFHFRNLFTLHVIQCLFIMSIFDYCWLVNNDRVNGCLRSKTFLVSKNLFTLQLDEHFVHCCLLDVISVGIWIFEFNKFRITFFPNFTFLYLVTSFHLVNVVFYDYRRIFFFKRLYWIVTTVQVPLFLMRWTFFIFIETPVFVAIDVLARRLDDRSLNACHYKLCILEIGRLVCSTDLGRKYVMLRVLKWDSHIACSKQKRVTYNCDVSFDTTYVFLFLSND